jgi:DNA polymerase III subunit gamma/tau
MSYLVLARKWRPKTFDDIVGQDYITQTLKNAVSSGKTAHAFIFSGPRGVGKTSTARIVAKALNCKNGPTPDPCSECTFCMEISLGKSLDVIEIDAASHTGVNDVREIIENIKYLPTSGKNKIYIIDEAHMLSQSAFNALLKTLEEPPPHVLFILATTEVHKIPVTILSRCQRYDFKKVTVEEIRKQLKTITSKESVNIDDETLYLISQEADGSLRDALSLMDQLIATFGNDIKHEEAIAILGILDKALLKSVLKSVLQSNTKSSIESLNNAIEKGISPRRFAEDLLKVLRYSVLVKTCGKSVVAELSEEEITDIEKLTSEVNAESLESLFNLMLEEAENIQKSFYPQMALELTLIKLSTMERIVPIEYIISRIESLRNSSGADYGKSGRMDEHRVDYNKKETPGDVEPEPIEKAEDPKPPEPEAKESIPKGNKEGSFIEFIKGKKRILGTRLEQANEIVIEDSRIRIICGKGSPEALHLKRQESKEALKNYSGEFYSREMRIDIEETDSPAKKSRGGGIQSKDIKEQKAVNRKKIHDDPIVKDAEEIFGGRVIDTKPN